tara:strand:+ start:120 stop:272 length:153 start_codon:yes stop_codon:yes gene_type:complete
MSHLDISIKNKIISLYNDGRYTQQELAEHFEVSVRSIKRWIKNKKEQKEL